MINLHLEWREVLWWMQGGMAGSHLRWSVYEDMVNKVWPQCTEQERRNIHYIMERDFGTYWRNSEGDWKPESEIFDKTAPSPPHVRQRPCCSPASPQASP